MGIFSRNRGPNNTYGGHMGSNSNATGTGYNNGGGYNDGRTAFNNDGRSGFNNDGRAGFNNDVGTGTNDGRTGLHHDGRTGLHNDGRTGLHNDGRIGHHDGRTGLHNNDRTGYNDGRTGFNDRSNDYNDGRGYNDRAGYKEGMIGGHNSDGYDRHNRHGGRQGGMFGGRGNRRQGRKQDRPLFDKHSGIYNRRPSFGQWLKMTWLDILTMIAMGAVGLGVYEADPAPNRSFPVTFADQQANIVYPQFAYPLRKEIIPIWAAAMIGALVPIVVILLMQIRIKSFWDVNNAVIGLLYSLIGAAVFQVFLKWLIGGLRPHFLDVCQPDPAKLAAGGSGYLNLMFTADICTGDRNQINDSLESFPSGHSTAAFAGLLFLYFYLNAKLKVFSNHHPAMWKLIALYAPVLGATLIAGALTIDKFHNWYDCLAGAIIGSVFAISAYRMVYASVWDFRFNHIPLTRHTPFSYGAGSPGAGGFESAVFTHKAGWGYEEAYGGAPFDSGIALRGMGGGGMGGAGMHGGETTVVGGKHMGHRHDDLEHNAVTTSNTAGGIDHKHHHGLGHHNNNNNNTLGDRYGPEPYDSRNTTTGIHNATTTQDGVGIGHNRTGLGHDGGIGHNRSNLGNDGVTSGGLGHNRSHLGNDGVVGTGIGNNRSNVGNDGVVGTGIGNNRSNVGNDGVIGSGIGNNRSNLGNDGVVGGGLGQNRTGVGHNEGLLHDRSNFGHDGGLGHNRTGVVNDGTLMNNQSNIGHHGGLGHNRTSLGNDGTLVNDRSNLGNDGVLGHNRTGLGNDSGLGQNRSGFGNDSGLGHSGTTLGNDGGIGHNRSNIGNDNIYDRGDDLDREGRSTVPGTGRYSNHRKSLERKAIGANARNEPSY